MADAAARAISRSSGASWARPPLGSEALDRAELRLGGAARAAEVRVVGVREAVRPRARRRDDAPARPAVSAASLRAENASRSAIASRPFAYATACRAASRRQPEALVGGELGEELRAPRRRRCGARGARRAAR